jgi:hypothetical protein
MTTTRVVVPEIQDSIPPLVKEQSRTKRARPYVQTFRALCNQTGQECTAENLRVWDIEHNDYKIHKIFNEDEVFEAGWRSIFNYVFYECLRTSIKITPADISVQEFNYSPTGRAASSLRLSSVRRGLDWTAASLNTRKEIIESEKRAMVNSARRLQAYHLSKREVNALLADIAAELKQ